MFSGFRSLLAVGCLYSAAAGAQLWTTAYYTAGSEAALPVAEIDFRAVTHLVHFSILPAPDGSLNMGVNGITPDTTRALVARAHEAHRKVLVCVGGADSEALFLQATAPARRGLFVSNLVSAVTAAGYDGLDLDWEPLPVADFSAYTNLAAGLRESLLARSPGSLLTVAAAAYPVFGDPPGASCAMFASIQGLFDQINVMTYDLSGPYDGWVSWFNSPLYDGGCRFPSTSNCVPSIDGSLRGFLAAGVKPDKLGVGIPFYGVVWQGSVSRPRQSWTAAPGIKQISYAEIMASYYQTNLYHWDTNAQAAFLGLDSAFVSYDDEQACQAKVRYVRDHALGGVMIWNLVHGHRPTLPLGQRDPLLRATADAMESR